VRAAPAAARALLAGVSLAGAFLACACLLAACGSGRQSSPLPPGNRIVGDRLTVYVSVPLDGPSAVSGEAVAQGAQLALDSIHGRIGRFRISLDPIDDASPGQEQWNAPAALLAAQTAAADRTTIGYIGDFNSGASAVSIPVLNRLAIAQISPASTAVGLTSDGVGSSPGEPEAYYPTPVQTFARVVPSDLVQAEVQVKLQQLMGCRSTYVLDDGEYDGEAIAQAFDEVAQQRGLQVVATQSYVPAASSYVSVGQTVEQSGADCVLIAAITDRNAAQVTTQVAAQVPSAELFGTAGLAESTFTDPAHGGIPAALDSRMLITAAAGDPDAGFPGAETFTEQYTHTYGPPEPVAIDGYEAMQLMLAAIRRATDDGRQQAQRIKVVRAVLNTRDRSSPLGTYSIERDGDTTIDAYGVYRVSDGRLAFWRSISG
jgi:branched-chain amino acid transport system substrate-binding protein